MIENYTNERYMRVSNYLPCLALHIRQRFGGQNITVDLRGNNLVRSQNQALVDAYGIQIKDVQLVFGTRDLHYKNVTEPKPVFFTKIIPWKHYIISRRDEQKPAIPTQYLHNTEIKGNWEEAITVLALNNGRDVVFTPESSYGNEILDATARLEGVAKTGVPVPCYNHLFTRRPIIDSEIANGIFVKAIGEIFHSMSTKYAKTNRKRVIRDHRIGAKSATYGDHVSLEEMLSAHYKGELSQ